jgi:hypothetical protein
MRTQRTSLILKKRFTTPNWVKVSVLYALLYIKKKERLVITFERAI